MLEIRAARSDELDTILALMCEAFGLPFGPARELFYKDPYFDIDKKRVLVDDGTLVSCLTIIDSPLWIGAAAVRVGGIAGVATRQTHRRRGYAGRLLVGTLSALRDQGYSLAALFPYSYDYYRRFGWERAGTQLRARVAPGCLPPFAGARHVRPAQPADRADMQRLYEAWSRHRTGRWLRDEKRWAYLFEHIHGRVVYKREALEGYALFELREEPSGERCMRLMELVAATDDARRGLTGFLAADAEAADLEYTAGWDDLRASGVLEGCETIGDRARPRVEAVPGVMFRVVDLGRCLEALSPNLAGFRGEVTFVMRDEFAPPHAPTAVTIAGDGVALSLETVDDAGRRPRVEGDVRAWSTVLAGYYSLADALALNRLRSVPEGAACAVAPLFPRRDPFIPLPDHF